MLLLNNSGRHYSPITSVGLDVTTQRRLRVPAQIIEQNSRLMSGDAIQVSHEGLTFLEPFFSTREFSLVNSLYLLPIIQSGTLFGVFLLVEQSTAKNETLVQNLKIIVGKHQSELYAEYAKRLIDLPSIPDDLFSTDIQLLLNRELSLTSAQQLRLLCMLLDVNRLIGDLSGFSSNINLVRIREDVSRILFTFVTDGGFVYPCRNNRILLCLRTRSITDPQFIAQHIETTLGDFYPGIIDVAAAILNRSCYPDEARNSAEIIQQLGISSSNA